MAKKYYDENGNEVKRGGCFKWGCLGIVIVLGLLLLIGIFGSSSNDSENNAESTTESTTENAAEQEAEISQAQDEETSDEPQGDESSNELVVGETMSFDSFNITITDMSLGTDYEGNNVLIYTYDWENTGEEPTMASMSFSLRGFQDNVETQSISFVEGLNLEAGQREVRPGGTVEGAQNSVGIDDMSQPLELELEETFSFSGEPYTTTVDLSELQ